MIDIASILSLASILIIIALLVMWLKFGKRIYYKSLGDYVGYVLCCMFAICVLVAQVLIIFNLHSAIISEWRMIGLYFTAIICFFTLLFLLTDFAEWAFERVTFRWVTVEWRNSIYVLFGICWVAQAILLLTR